MMVDLVVDKVNRDFCQMCCSLLASSKGTVARMGLITTAGKVKVTRPLSIFLSTTTKHESYMLKRICCRDLNITVSLSHHSHN